MLMSFNSPAAQQKRLRQPWSLVAVFYIASIYFFYSYFVRDWIPHTWVMPAENQLVTENGFFSEKHTSSKYPYVFKSDTGSKITLACNPEEYGTDCLEDQYKIPLVSLALQHVTVGYFHVGYSRHRASSNVLATISENGQPIISYEMSKSRISKWSVQEEEIKRSVFSMFLDLLPVAFFGTIATILAVTKIKHRRNPEQAPA